MAEDSSMDNEQSGIPLQTFENGIHFPSSQSNSVSLLQDLIATNLND